MFESWSMFSFFSITPSIQRETVMPGLPIIPGAKRSCSHLRSTFQTRAQCVHDPGTATG